MTYVEEDVQLFVYSYNVVIRIMDSIIKVLILSLYTHII